MTFFLAVSALLLGFFGPASFVRAYEATRIASKNARLDERGWATAGEWCALFWGGIRLVFWAVAIVVAGSYLFLNMQRLDFAPEASVLFNAWLIGIAAFVWLLFASSTVTMLIAWLPLFALAHGTGYRWFYVALLVAWTAAVARAAWQEFATKPEPQA